ncbi:TetR/AcrR family transcriptional regulator [Dactylosporangium sp. CA-092794]|uniref:TetR/AcrR family transcriptional regulator n=1 Tax=Dactylosporangium sp. CA-092794 TaxID=3239929 RepID=UPI003D8C162D
MAQREGGGLRADAAQNKERLLAAAREVFAEQGLGVSMRQVARHAGVSEPTLRRRFASREALIAEAFEDKVVLYAEAAEAALGDLDPWVGFTSFLRQMASMQLVDRGFAEMLTMTFPASMRYEQGRRRAWDAIQRLIERAKTAGRLREDFVAEDIVLLLLAHAGVVAGSGRLAERFSARLLGYLLQAFAAPGAVSLPPAPSVAETYRALLRLHDNDPA